jgi:hypothetical protein
MLVFGANGSANCNLLGGCQAARDSPSGPLAGTIERVQLILLEPDHCTIEASRSARNPARQELKAEQRAYADRGDRRGHTD